jgi:hypothetical protein
MTTGFRSRGKAAIRRGNVIRVNRCLFAEHKEHAAVDRHGGPASQVIWHGIDLVER